ncbi:MAG TPA: inositol monophosphatase [Polyangia bacterium]|jgi:histidinol-phosphatase|nr:inositol monophosphatase [Polyangia bacterium]
MNFDELRDTALRAAQAASEAVFQNWRSAHFGAGPALYAEKTDLSPVTGIDLLSHQVIARTILDAYPSHQILSEEGPEVEHPEQAPFLWVIDPVDGTKNFIRGLPFFSIQIALFCGNELTVGVSSAPALGETAYAVRDAGAFLNGRRLRVSETQSLDRAYVNHGSVRNFELTGRSDQLSALCRSTWTARGFGDSWSYHWLANGALDVIVEARTRIWDIAAVALIVQEAGGWVSTLDGQRIGVNSTSILATNERLHAPILKLFASPGP